MSFSLVLTLIQLVATLAAAAWAWRLRAEPSAQAIGVAATAWLVLATLVYWIAGPYSFGLINNELDYSVTQYLFFDTLPAGTRFAHGFEGGNDVIGMSAVSGAIVSLDRSLVAALPLWLANAIIHVLATGFGLAGGYLICRRWGGTDRLTALAAGMLCTIANEFTSTVIFSVGLGYAFLPLLTYLVILRIGRPHYWLGVAAGALINAVSCTPSHSMVATVASLGFAALLTGPRATLRAIPAITVVGLLVAVNWSETVFAMASIGPMSYRAGEAGMFGDAPLARIASVMTNHKEVYAAIGIALIALWTLRRRKALWPTTLLVLLHLVPVLLFMVPWQQTGAKALGAFNFSYLLFGTPVLAALLVAVAAPRWKHRAPWVAVALVAVAFGRLAWLDAYSGAVWLSQGGLRTIDPAPLRALEWRPAEPTRVVSMPYRLPENVAAAAGFDALDGFTAIVPRSLGIWWRWGVGRLRDVTPDTGRLTLEHQFDAMCCASYRLADFASLDALRIANVGAVLSRLPLDGLEQLAGPRSAATPPRAGAPKGETLRRYLGYIVEPPPVMAYAVPDPLPRVFAATGVVTVEDAIGERDLVQATLAHALGRALVMRQADAAALGAPAATTLRVERFATVTDGYDIELHAPEGGLVAVNGSWSPFWVALADGVPAITRPANTIHTAIAVPPGTRHVTLRWHRPLLRDRLTAALGPRPAPQPGN